MSADNAYAVFVVGDKWYVSHVFMSPMEDDCLYLQELAEKDKLSPYESLEKALVAAHEFCKEDTVVEYGVITCEALTEPCGKCNVCVDERKVIADDIERCDGCKDPITDTDWTVMTAKGTFHKRCEPR